MSEAPKPSNHPILVTAALIESGDLFLIARRRNDRPVEGGKWEFPGGKVEEFEHPESGLVREIREELSLEIKVESFFTLSSHIYEQKEKRLHIVLLCYRCQLVGGSLSLNDHSEVQWVRREDMSLFEFAAADVPIVAALCDSRHPIKS
jgi:8-oxo-dGTP diphosphatase